MTRLRERNEDMEARAVRHAARIEELEDTEARLRRQIRTLKAEPKVQAGIIVRRNRQVAALTQQAATAGLAPGPLDTGTPGVEVSPR